MTKKKQPATQVQMLPMSAVEVNAGQLEGLPANPRDIRDEKFEKLKANIQKYPELLEYRSLMVYPMPNGKHIIIGGNMRYRAMQELGYTEVPCVIIPAETPVERLGAYTILDNNGFGKWDWDLLANEWSDWKMEDLGLDWEFAGFGEMESNAEKESKQVVEDDFDEEKEKIPTRVSKGEVWLLGEHRLMCGSSTEGEDMAKLMNGERADIAFASPPYNMMAGGIDKALQSGKVKLTYDLREGTYNEYEDNLNDEDYGELLKKALGNAIQYADDVMYNIGILASSKLGIIDMLTAYKNKFCDIIVWKKNNSIPLGLPSNKGMVSHICELIFCFNQKGNRSFSHPQWEKCLWKGESVKNIIESKNNSNNEYAKIHHATFPLEFASQVCEMYSGQSVLDQFGGTGTTLIACEQLNRKCYMMELDPHYCDVIIARWEKLTGKQAVKLQE